LQAPLPEYSLAVWHGFNLALMMSFIALVGGILVLSVAPSPVCLARSVVAGGIWCQTGF